LFPPNTWVFDLEIANPILNKGYDPIPGINYCGGWGDHRGMGISVITVCRPDNSETQVFEGTNLYPFCLLLAKADLMIGYNSRFFDAKVLAAKGIYIQERRHLDFLHEIKKSIRRAAPKGYKLEDVSLRCGGPRKSEDGALIPVLWQEGEVDRVVKCCINDIKGTSAIARYYAANRACVPGPDGPVQLRVPDTIAREG
jgi:hypothetical protein